MKKLLAVLLCVCLLVPAMGLTAVPSAGAETGYVLADLGYRVNTAGTTGGWLVSQGCTFDPIDLTQYNWNNLAIQLDTFVDGDNALQYGFSGYDGQTELTSSGTCDKEEYRIFSGVQLKFRQWNRYTIKLSSFSGDADFDKTAWNYFRIYFKYNGMDSGLNFALKICNVRLVDLTKEAPSEEEDPLGDGTFDVEAPVWEEVKLPQSGDKIVAGYNLVDYVEAHKDVRQVQICLEKGDYAPIIQSLCDGLAAAGGGALYIPAGVYPCRTEVVMKGGVMIYGDWTSPEENPKANGTILAVYAGKGSANAMPFMNLGGSCMLRYLTFWYPEQGFENNTVTPYSPTVSMASYTWAQNLTFVNAYTAIKSGPSFHVCPNVQDVYGTALFLGLNMDCTIDIARIENVNLSAKYWEESGLEGAPTTDAQKASLEAFIKFNATGVNVLRIDWSYITFVNVEGYATGMYFNESSTGAANGQCLNLHFKDCNVGLLVSGAHPCGEMISNSKFENCQYGVWLVEKETNSVTSGVISIINCEIDATEYAIYTQQGIMLEVLSCTIKNGTVGGTFGWMGVMNTTFESEAPQVYLENGMISAYFVGCTTKNGGKLTIENEGFCPVTYDPEKADVPEVVTYTDEEAKKQERHVENDTLYIVDDLNKSGKVDVTAALQTKLNTAKENGGGIVFLTNGHYLVNGTVTIPTGVELRGALDLGDIGSSDVTAAIYVTRTTELDTPTIIMEEGSGMRGMAFYHPDMAYDTNYSRGRISEYPYLVQGRGKDIYIINVSMRNAYNGVDMMTYRCDNHYVDYLGGMPFNTLIQVGGGATNGVIRNIQVNPNAYRSDWDGRTIAEAHQTIMYRHAQNYAVIIRVGHAEDEFVYDNFNYCGAVGIQLVGEETGKPTVRAVGNAMDYTTVAYEVLDCEQLDILNTQMCCFNQLGSALKKTMYHISLCEENTGVVNAVGALFWQDTDAWLNVQGGTLNIYGTNDNSGTSKFVEMSDKANLNLYAMYVKDGNLNMNTPNADRITINGAYAGSDGINKFAVSKNVLRRTSWWNFPTDQVELPSTTNVLFAEGFGTGYNFQSMTKAVSAGSTAAIQSGRLVLDVGTGINTGATTKITGMTPDAANSIYRLETRVSFANLSDGGMLMLTLDASTGDVLTPFMVTKDGVLTADQYGDTTELCDVTVNSNMRQFYRIQVWFDMRNEGSKTYQIVMTDDDGEVLAESELYDLPDDMQAEGETFASLYLGAMDSSAEAADAATKVGVDYLFISQNTGTLGDVNDDGNVDSTDARMTLQYFVGSLSEGDLNMAVADVSGDGNVDSTDARLILQKFVGSIDEFPAA